MCFVSFSCRRFLSVLWTMSWLCLSSHLCHRTYSWLQVKQSEVKITGCKSRLCGEWFKTFHFQLSSSTVVMYAVWGWASSWSNKNPRVSIPLVLFWIVVKNISVSQHASARLFYLEAWSQPGNASVAKNWSLNFLLEINILKFLILGESVD